MNNEIHAFLTSHMNTKRAQKCRPVEFKKKPIKDDGLEALLHYEFDFSYPNTRIAPSLIKIGYKEDRPCIRIDEKNRVDRNKFNDYFADDLNCLKKLIQHLNRMQLDYERTTWFIRAQLIPSIFKKLFELSKSH